MIPQRLLDYIDKELARLDTTTESALVYFEEMGVENFLTHKAFEAFRAEYIKEILFEIKEHLNDVKDTATTEELIVFFQQELEYYRKQMLSGSVIPYNTNLMTNVVGLWKHESNVRVISLLESLLRIISSSLLGIY